MKTSKIFVIKHQSHARENGKMKHWNDLYGSIFFNKPLSQPIVIGETYIRSLRIENDQNNCGIALDAPIPPDRPPEQRINKGYTHAGLD